jgi:RNA polymerase sigma-70 factor (ECF subfamily)
VPPDDPDVLDAARAGDRQALETLLSGHYDRVHALCRRMLGNEADALDAAQDALLSAVRSIARFDGRSSFGTWIYRIATNACLDELRRRRRRPVVGLPGEVDDDWDRAGSGRSGRGRRRGAGDVGGGGGGGAGDVHPAFGAGGRDPAEEATARVDVDAALRRLAPEHRVALVLRDVCDLPYEEIAVILEVPIGTVRSRIARGRGALADLMTGPTVGGGQPDGDEGNPTGAPVVQPGDRTENRTP